MEDFSWHMNENNKKYILKSYCLLMSSDYFIDVNEWYAEMNDEL